MRVPGGEERTGDENVKFAGEFAADHAMMRRTAAGDHDEPRDDFTVNA